MTARLGSFATWFVGVVAVAAAVAGGGVAEAGSGKSDKPVFAKPPTPAPSSAPAASTPNVGRGFGGTHTNRPLSAIGTGRPLAPTGSGRPLAPIGRDRGLARIGTDRPLAPIGGGGPDAVGPPPVTEPTFPGHHPGNGHGHGRTILVVEPQPKDGVGLDVVAPDSGDSAPFVEPSLPGDPGLEPTSRSTVVEPFVDPIKLEMAERLRAEGHVQFLRGEFHLAEASLQSAVDLVPTMNDARFELAFSLLANGRVNSAAKEFIAAEAHDPLPFKSALDARAAVGSQQTFDTCLQRAEAYHAAYPMDSDALFVHALMRWWGGKSREAGLDLASLAGADPAYSGLKAGFVGSALDEALKPQ